MKNRILLFAGAGASKAINGEQFPTTVEFFDKLPKEIKNNNLFKHIQKFLTISNNEKPIDIEEMLFELKKLNDFSKNYLNQKEIIGYSLSDQKILNVLSGQGNGNFGHFGSVMQTLSAAADDLSELINATVYDFYNHEPDESELIDNWLYTLETLLNNENVLNIFTTNYDVSIEAALNIFLDNKSDKILGTTGRLKKKLEIENWLKRENANSQLLTKLHGSINWQFDKGDIYVGSHVYTGSHNRQAIIYPGFKGKSDFSFFQPLHNYFAECLEYSDLCIFIGFAFRDDYINSLISERINQNCKVFVINPNNEVKFPSRRPKATYINNGFNSDSIREIVKLYK